MKILIAVTSFQSYALVRGQVSYMRNKGTEVVFVSSDGAGVKDDITAEDGTFRSIEIEREISIVKDFRSVLAARKILKEERPDIVNASTPKAGLIFMLASAFVSTSYPVFTLRGLRSDTLSGMKRNIVRFTEYLTCKLAKKVIVIAPSLKDHAQDLGIVQENKAVVFGKGSSNGINIKKFSPSAEILDRANKIRQEFLIPEDGIVFGCVGRIVKDKGIVEVYQAFETLQQTNSNIYLILTGDFEQGDPISSDQIAKMQANPFVFFIKHSSDVPAVLSAYDVMILFSYREGFGNVVLEASAMERAVIVSDIPGARDTIEDTVTGFLAESKNVADLASKMERYILNPKLRKAHGSAGRKRVVQSFASEYIWQQQYEFYTEIMQKRSTNNSAHHV